MPKIVYTSIELNILQQGTNQLGGPYHKATLGKVVSDPTITGSGYTLYKYNPFVNSAVNPSNGTKGYSYYLFYTNSLATANSQTYSGTFKSNEDITVQTLLVGGGGTSNYSLNYWYGGGGAGGVIAGSFKMKANKTYTINVGLGGVFDNANIAGLTSSIVSPNGTTIVSANGGTNGYNSGQGGSSGGISYDSSFKVLNNLASTTASGGSSDGPYDGGIPGGGGAYGLGDPPGNGGLCFPYETINNTSYNIPLVFADGLSSNILFGGGGGGGGGYYGESGGSGGGGIYGGGSVGGGGGGGGGFVSSPQFGIFTPGTQGQSGSGGGGGYGGIGGGGGGGGYGGIGGGPVSGNGGNGVVMIYFKNP